MSAHISELLALELHPILRLAPLELKNLCIHAGAKFSEKNVTAIFSNMSVVKMPESYVPYIERFGVYTNTPKLELCLCSFQDKLSFAFTSRYDTENIERNFYRMLKEQGISSEEVKVLVEIIPTLSLFKDIRKKSEFGGDFFHISFMLEL